MDTYLRWQHRFPQNVKDAYYTEYTTMPTYGSGSTPNQRIMWAAACKLACETWGTAAVTSVSNAANKYGDPTGKAYMMAICDRTVKYNFEERWAKHYLAIHPRPAPLDRRPLERSGTRQQGPHDLELGLDGHRVLLLQRPLGHPRRPRLDGAGWKLQRHLRVRLLADV